VVFAQAASRRNRQPVTGNSSYAKNEKHRRKAVLENDCAAEVTLRR
jgi:hypothetical protein